MVKVKKANRIYTINERDLDEYLANGYDQVEYNEQTGEWDVIKSATGNRDFSLTEYNDLKAKNEELTRRLNEMEAQMANGVAPNEPTAEPAVGTEAAQDTGEAGVAGAFAAGETPTEFAGELTPAMDNVGRENTTPEAGAADTEFATEMDPNQAVADALTRNAKRGRRG